MKKTIFISIILVTSGLLAEPIIPSTEAPLQELIQIQEKDSLAIVKELNQMGLELNTISSILNQAPQNYYSNLNSFISSLTASFPDLNSKKVIHHIGKQNLQGKYNTYTSYSSRIGLLQSTYKIALSPDELNKLQVL